MQANKIALLPSAPSGTGIGNTSFTPDQSLEMIGTRYGFFLVVFCEYLEFKMGILYTAIKECSHDSNDF